MTTSKLETLLAKLKERTEDSYVTWEETESENQFQAVLGQYIVRIVEIATGEPEVDYIFRILGDEGAVIETISDVDLHRQNPDFPAFQTMRQIFNLARRSSMGADKVIDSIIRELDDIRLF